MLKAELMRRAQVDSHTHWIGITPGILSYWGLVCEEQNYRLKEPLNGQQLTASQHRCADLIRVSLFKDKL